MHPSYFDRVQSLVEKGGILIYNTSLGGQMRSREDIEQIGMPFTDMATEASNSRMFGAIHYRSDCVQGLISGKAVGQYAVQRAMTDGAE